jgi:hypothetical protein
MKEVDMVVVGALLTCQCVGAEVEMRSYGSSSSSSSSSNEEEQEEH